MNVFLKIHGQISWGGRGACTVKTLFLLHHTPEYSRVFLNYTAVTLVTCEYIVRSCFPASNAGMIAAATVGSIVGLVAMVLFLIFILKRRRDTEEEIANEIK